jgi:uncharacterized FlgJ-related protein
MFYKFDNNSLVWKKDWKKTKIALSVVVVLMFASFLLGRFQRFSALDQNEKELLVISLEAEKNKFTKERMVDELKRLNVKFPHIVMAQSIVETGNFKSRIFKENHNLFGMKQATVRINTAKGTQHGHAYYDNWFESIYDYAFYQSRYLGNIRNEREYFQYLSSVYAEAGDGYVEAVKNTIEKENLKSLF